MRIVLDSSDLSTKGGRFIGALIGESFKAVRAQAAASYQRFQVQTYWKQHTRRVARSFKVHRTSATGVQLRSENKIAHFLNVGTKAHDIVPRRARALSFYWAKAGGRVVFGKVSHPGTKAIAYDKMEAFHSLPELHAKGEAARDAALDRVGLS